MKRTIGNEEKTVAFRSTPAMRLFLTDKALRLGVGVSEVLRDMLANDKEFLKFEKGLRK